MTAPARSSVPLTIGDRPPSSPLTVAGALAAAVFTLAIGHLMVPIAFALAPEAGLTAAAPGVSLPTWVFGAVWTVIYPALGVAVYRVAKRRERPGATEALVCFAVVALHLLAFLPVTAAAAEQRVTAMMDVLGLCGSYALAFVFRRIDRATMWWLLPLLIWMPVTTALKLATLGAA